MAATRMTPALVFLAAVAMAGRAGQAPAAEPDRATAIAHAVEANNDFAFDLYAQLAKENSGENLFFSPYSISSALAMTAEGARGTTAEEMGKILRYGPGLRREDDDAQGRPWRMELIHEGLSELNDRLARGKDKTDVNAARAEIARLQKAHEAAKAKTQELLKAYGAAKAKTQELLKAYKTPEAKGKAEELLMARKRSELREALRTEARTTATLNKALAGVDQYELRIANALWGEKTYPFLDAYVKTIGNYYKAGGVFPADFKANFPGERARINKWVEAQTSNRIKDLIPEVSAKEGSLTRLILTNAIFFKGEWSVPFEVADTKPLAFTLSAGKTVETPIMNARGLKVARYAAFNADGSLFGTPKRILPGRRTGLYPDKDGFAMLEMPYKGDDVSMVIVAPNNPDGLVAIEKTLTEENFAAWVGRLRKRETHVLLPKFELETNYKMAATLKAMGMVRAFTDPRKANSADFSGMSASNQIMQRLYITKVLHKAFVEINEKGTEAAAATAGWMSKATAAPMDVPFTPTFKADRPFIFAVRDVKTNAILFLGRMTNPKE